MADNLSQKSHKTTEKNKYNNSVHRTTSESLRLNDTEKGNSHPTSLQTASHNSRKISSFQITSVTVGSRVSADAGEDSADDLDESHTDDISRVTDFENETPSFSEDTFSKDDVFYNASSASLGCAPVIPTSSQYGLAIVGQDGGNPHGTGVPALNNSDVGEMHVSVTDSGTGSIYNIIGNSKPTEGMKEIQEQVRNERFKVVKIESTEPFRRGRWMCMDYLDHTTTQQNAPAPTPLLNPLHNSQHPVDCQVDPNLNAPDSGVVLNDVQNDESGTHSDCIGKPPKDLQPPNAHTHDGHPFPVASPGQSLTQPLQPLPVSVQSPPLELPQQMGQGGAQGTAQSMSHIPLGQGAPHQPVQSFPAHQLQQVIAQSQGMTQMPQMQMHQQLPPQQMQQIQNQQAQMQQMQGQHMGHSPAQMSTMQHVQQMQQLQGQAQIQQLPGQQGQIQQLPNQQAQMQQMQMQQMGGQQVGGQGMHQMHTQQASMQSMPQQNMTQQNMPQQNMPQQNMTQQSMPQQSMPQQSMPQQSMPQQSMPQQSMPQQSMPQQTMTQQSMPQQTIPQQSMPQQSMPQQNIQQQNIPQQTMPQQSIPQQNMTQQNMPQQNIPQQNMPQQSIPQQNMPQQSMPQQNMPQQSMPQQNMTQQSMPQQSMPQQSMTQQNMSQQNMTQQSLPQQSMPQQVHQMQGQQNMGGQQAPMQHMQNQTQMHPMQGQQPHQIQGHMQQLQMGGQLHGQAGMHNLTGHAQLQQHTPYPPPQHYYQQQGQSLTQEVMASIVGSQQSATMPNGIQTMAPQPQGATLPANLQGMGSHSIQQAPQSMPQGTIQMMTQASQNIPLSMDAGQGQIPEPVYMQPMQGGHMVPQPMLHAQALPMVHPQVNMAMGYGTQNVVIPNNQLDVHISQQNICSTAPAPQPIMSGTNSPVVSLPMNYAPNTETQNFGSPVSAVVSHVVNSSVGLPPEGSNESGGGTPASDGAGPQQPDINDGKEEANVQNEDSESASGTSAVAIDNKIEQAMDLVKSHLMFAVREEVEVLKEKIAELMERINQLEMENSILRAHATQETLAQLAAPPSPPTGPAS